MSLIDSIFGSKNKTNSTATTKSTGTVDTTSIMEQINNLVEGISSSGTSTTTKGGERENQTITAIIETLGRNFGDDFRTRAIEDSDQAMRSAMAGVLEMGLPDIRTGNTTAGGYDSTTAQLMQDNLAAQAAREGATVRLAALQTAGQQQLEAVQQAIAAVLSGQEGTLVSQVEEAQNRSAQETGKSTGKENRTVTEDTTQTGSTTARGRDSIFGQVGNFIGNVT